MAAEPPGGGQHHRGASKYEHVVQNIALSAQKKTIAPEAMAKCDQVWNKLHGQYFSYHVGGRGAMAFPPRPPKK